jgi:katanin p80 WD40 repeat-containing subunit B1
VACGGWSNSKEFDIGIWDVTGNKELAKLKAHAKGVDCLEFSPDGKVLASGGSDNVVKQISELVKQDR